jgi:hypothetical protein
VLLLGALGCREDLSTPGECPELCPGTPLTIRDTVIVAVPGGDSSFAGYTPLSLPPALLVASGLPAGDAYTFVVFGSQRRDSVSVAAETHAFTLDSLTLTFSLQARDSLVKNVRLLVYRVPITLDSSATFSQIGALLTPAALVDSVMIPDSVLTGSVRALFDGNDLPKLVTPPGDSGRLGFALSLRADGPTGVRLGTTTGGSVQPSLDTYGHAEGVTDTTLQKQQLTVSPDSGRYNFVLSRRPATTPDLLVIGGTQRARSLIRFVLPSFLKDSVSIIKATLGLTPVEPIFGLPTDSTGSLLFVRGVAVDLGGKSPILNTATLAINQQIVESTTAPVLVDVRALVLQWLVTNGPPSVVSVGLSPEGGSFMQPVFYSTRSPMGHPTLQITYALPTRPGNP